MSSTMGLLSFIADLFSSTSSSNETEQRGDDNNASNIDNLSIVPSKTSCKAVDVDLRIPPDVLDLLLFIDGPYKNYERGMIVVEPSLISIELPIGEPITPAPRLNYYPSYAKLSPDERATYLNWLQNVDTPIDIGYVFIFYYGLERILLDYPEKWESALQMIIRLRQAHSNGSFLSYSHDAITAICLLKNRFDLLESYMQTADNGISMAKLASMAGHNMGLIAPNIIRLASAVGFKNHRYIKQHPRQFEHTLHEILERTYENAKYPLTPQILKEAPLRTGYFFANYSLNNRSLDIPDILEHPVVQKDLYELLVEVHNIIKKIPMKDRL